MDPTDTGPYADMIIATKKDDMNYRTEGGWHTYAQCMVLLYSLIGIFIGVSVIGYMLWNYIGLLLAGGIIGLCFWACAYYGTNRSILDRFRYRTTREERARILRRLSDTKKSS